MHSVFQLNEFGQSDPLTAETPIIAKMPFDKPDAPRVPEIIEVGSDFVSLTWEKPKHDGGGRIKGYWIDKREHGTDNWSRVNLQPCITNIINIPKLIEDKRYEFRVFAENEAGMSKPSMNSQSVKIKDPKAAVIPEFSSGLKKCHAQQGKSAKFDLTFNGSREPEKFIVVLNLKFTMKVTNKFLLFMMFSVRIKIRNPAEHQTMVAEEHPRQT